jgi:thiol-disulfide isomerase/thioredoxin
VAVLAVFMVIGVAFWRQLDDEPSQNAPGAAGLAAGQQTVARAHRDADTADALAGPRAKAALPSCPAPGSGAGPQALRGITVECAADGSPVDVAAAVAGRPTLLNLWAYWCGPCADELPALAEYQRRMGGKVMVLTVHQDENETAGLLRLAELGVKLPTLQDGRRVIAAALRVPNVMPATAVLRADGTVAQIMPRPFTSADDIAGAVNSELGVSG